MNASWVSDGALRPPDPPDQQGLVGWLTSPGADAFDPTLATADREWIQVKGLSRDQDAPAPSEAATQLLSALWHTPADHRFAGFGFRATWDGQQLHIALSGPNVADALRAQFRNAELADAPPRPNRSPSMCLAGVPQAPVGDGPPILQRLAEAALPPWEITTQALPVQRPGLLRLANVLISHETLLEQRLSESRRVSSTATRSAATGEDRILQELLLVERRRVLRALSQGAFLTSTWVWADDPATAAAVAAMVVAAHAPRQRAIRPIQAVPAREGGPNPNGLLLPHELGALWALPHHEVAGFQVVQDFRFDSVPPPVPRGRSIQLGTTPTGEAVEYPLDRLTGHAMVAGSTGSGKSTFIWALLQQAVEHDVPFLVIEPTKQEHVALPFESLERWRIGAPGQAWRLNPLEVPRGTTIDYHIDQLIALFRSTFALYPPLPEVLDRAIRGVYRRFNYPASTDVVPTLSDLLDEGTEVVRRLGYAGEISLNVSAAWEARIGSLLEGEKGRTLLTEDPFPIDELRSQPTVVNLDEIGSDEEKQFVMGLILLRLTEAHRGNQAAGLEHLVVLEEAHRLLSTSSSSEWEPSSRFATESFVGMLAEARSAGSGVIVVDQTPGRLARGTLANTNLSVALRLLDGDDVESMRHALAMTDDQVSALAQLEPHEGIVFAAGMDRPMRLDLERWYPNLKPPEPQLQSAGQRDLDADLSARIDATLRSRTTLEQRAQAASLLEDEMSRRGPGHVASFDEAAATAMERVLRTRHLSRTQRHQVIQATLTDAPEAYRMALLDGSFPHPFCADACPHGGCLAGELVGARGTTPLRAPLRPPLLPDRALADALNACEAHWRSHGSHE